MPYEKYVKRYCKYKDYIITINIESYKTYGEDDKEIFDKTNATYNIKDFKIESIEHIATNILLSEILCENQYNANNNYFMEVGKLYENRYIDYFMTYERALIEDFIKNKQYLLYPNGYVRIHKDYYDNGMIKCEFFHNNGKINGICKTYYENKNNSIKMIQEYVDGIKHGFFKKYHENGNINIDAMFDMNNITSYKVYNKDNKLIYDGLYNENKLIYGNVYHPFSGNII
jgi:antitoxin component YwqK of YwqJK toxin-antitoxin module